MSHLAQVFNAQSYRALPSVEALADQYSLNQIQREFIDHSRQQISQILKGEDPRLLLIIGPCSIHDPEAGLEYAQKLAQLQHRYRDQLLIVMRTYFEKPRTRTGWKGLVVDPNLDGSQNLAQGLATAREFLTQVIDLKLATATEFLDTNIAPYLADLICWGAIGARTAESQPHRQLASALPFPVGIKNGTGGDIDIAINAIHAMQEPHLMPFSGSERGALCITSQGNPFGHIILRGGKTPNYQSPHVVNASTQLSDDGLRPRLVIDCSHGNSEKIALNQLKVAKDIAKQLRDGERCIAGVMCESFLEAGNQNVANTPLTYGQSITDACLDWQQSQQLIEQLAQAINECQTKRYSTVA